MPRFKDQAICIRHLDWSETSQVVVLLTREHGKVRGLAKGAKRTSPSAIARFSGGIELLTRGEIVATTRPTAALATLTEWDLQDDCFHLRHNLEAQRVAMAAADLCNAMLADEDPHPGAYALMHDLLEALRTSPPQAALLTFQWGLLADCGYRPELDADVRSGEPLGDASAYTFDPVAGGLTLSNGVADWRVRAATVQLLRRLSAGEPFDAQDQDGVTRANRLLCVYARAILDRELPTMRLILGEKN